MKQQMTNNGSESHRRGGFANNGLPAHKGSVGKFFPQNTASGMGGGGRKCPPKKPGKSNVVKS